jgi:hypothetical protein
MVMQVFSSELELTKHTLRQEFEHFMNMLDCMNTDPLSLDYKVTSLGVKVHFSVEQETT